MDESGSCVEHGNSKHNADGKAQVHVQMQTAGMHATATRQVD
jgi:hypothetical protein